LENRRSKNDKVSRRMWEVVETKAGDVGLTEAKEGRKKRGKEKDMRTERTEKEERGKEKT